MSHIAQDVSSRKLYHVRLPAAGRRVDISDYLPVLLVLVGNQETGVNFGCHSDALF
jgi:hypothetical protein